MKTQFLNPAGEFMATTLQRYSEQRPELMNETGMAFWPVPLFFPQILSRCLMLLHEEAVKSFQSGEHKKSKDIREVRCLLSRLTHDGDIGQDHLEFFLVDHPEALQFSHMPTNQFPFWNFTQEVLNISDGIVLLGLLSRNEEGSYDEASALPELGIINRKGEYASVHLQLEEEHGRIAGEMGQIIEKYPDLSIRFQEGKRFHDEIYSSILV